jgi:tetratricopeptide (TPR) repeat protein
LQALERFAEAEEAFRKAVTVADTKGGYDELEVARVLTSMAAAYDHQHRAGEALAIAERALAIRESRVPADSPLVAQSHQWLAAAAQGRFDFDRAIIHYNMALAVFDDEKHRSEETVAIIAANLGYVYVQKSRYGDAEPLLQRVVSIREKAAAASPRNLVLALGNLGQPRPRRRPLHLRRRR